MKPKDDINKKDLGKVIEKPVKEAKEALQGKDSKQKQSTKTVISKMSL